MSTITPTVGRKVWLWLAAHSAAILDPKQAIDATVVFVHPDGKVNLAYQDHVGAPGVADSVDLLDPSENDKHGAMPTRYATWMPFQMGQVRDRMLKDVAPAPGAVADTPAPSSPPAETSTSAPAPAPAAQ